MNEKNNDQIAIEFECPKCGYLMKGRKGKQLKCGHCKVSLALEVKNPDDMVIKVIRE